MMQKSLLHIFLLLILLSACKMQKNTVLNKGVTDNKRTSKSEAELYISSIGTDYILKDSSDIIVYVNVELEKLEENNISGVEDLRKIFKINWILQSATGIKEKYQSGKVDLRENKSSLKENVFSFSMTIPRIREHSDATLVLEFIDLAAARKFVNETLLDFNTKRPNHLYEMFLDEEESPSFQSYIQKGRRVTFRSKDNLAHDLILKRYDARSPAALSPMSSSKRNELMGYVEAESIDFKSGESVTLDKEGVYVLFGEPDVIDNGFGFMVVDDRYPRLTEKDELLDPLVYMSTNDEISQLNNTTDFKKSMDLYFLNMTSGNEEAARNIIRSYYRRVQKANTLFTNYKEGWKTDKGMIYTILGPPIRIQRNGLREVWFYSQSANFSEIIFTFYKKPNQFSENHYELVRYPEYGAYWYPFVEAWRTGSVVLE